MFPAGYKKSTEYPGFPWICAVRSCRTVTNSVISLGNHWNVSGGALLSLLLLLYTNKRQAKHKKCLLNDNMDSTFSVIGSYNEKNERGVTPAVVVSRNPLDPNASPMKPASLSKRYHASLTNSRRKQDVPTARRAAVDTADVSDRISPTDFQAEPVGPAEALEPVVQSDTGDTRVIWEYVAPFLKVHKEMPYLNWARFVATLPRVRDLVWNAERIREHPYRDSHARDVTALMVQITGIEAEYPCRTCSEGKGPFKGCIMISPAAPAQAKSGVLSCANCYYHCNQSYCSHRTDLNFKRMHRQSGQKHKYTQEPRLGVQRAERAPKPASYNVKLLADQAGGKTGVGPDGKHNGKSASTTYLAQQLHSSLSVFEPSEIISIEMAAPDRSYRMIRGKNGELISMGGALIPEKYDLDHSIEGRPWICPVRSCRCVFKRMSGLGAHFPQKHRHELLNDNLDGTFSLVGVYKKPIPGSNVTTALVISQKPMSEREAPVAEAKIPGHLPLGKSIKPTQAAPSNLSADPTTGLRDDKYSSLRSKLWDSILIYMAPNTTIPNEEFITSLLALPRQRSIHWRPGWTRRRLINNPKEILGLLFHLVGFESPDSVKPPCTECRRGTGPFDGCYLLPPNKGFENFTASVLLSCANCVFVHRVGSCSVKISWKVREALMAHSYGDVAAHASNSASLKRRRISVSEENNENEGPAVIRRSGRLQQQPEEESSREPKRRMITLSLSRANSNSAIAQQKTATNGSSSHARASAPSAVSSALISTGQIQSEELLEMEDWEMAPGRLRAVKAQRNESESFCSVFTTG